MCGHLMSKESHFDNEENVHLSSTNNTENDYGREWAIISH